MSDVKVGDRVRVVIEGEVRLVYTPQIVYIEGWAIPLVGKHGVVSIEVIPAPFVAPLKRWAQVVEGLDRLWTRRYRDEDTFQDSDAQWFSDDYLESSSKQLAERLGLRIVSEGVDDERA